MLFKNCRSLTAVVLAARLTEHTTDAKQLELDTTITVFTTNTHYTCPCPDVTSSVSSEWLNAASSIASSRLSQSEPSSYTNGATNVHSKANDQSTTYGQRPSSYIVNTASGRQSTSTWSSSSGGDASIASSVYPIWQKPLMNTTFVPSSSFQSKSGWLSDSYVTYSTTMVGSDTYGPILTSITSQVSSSFSTSDSTGTTSMTQSTTTNVPFASTQSASSGIASTSTYSGTTSTTAGIAVSPIIASTASTTMSSQSSSTSLTSYSLSSSTSGLSSSTELSTSSTIPTVPSSDSTSSTSSFSTSSLYISSSLSSTTIDGNTFTSTSSNYSQSATTTSDSTTSTSTTTSASSLPTCAFRLIDPSIAECFQEAISYYKTETYICPQYAPNLCTIDQMYAAGYANCLSRGSACDGFAYSANQTTLYKVSNHDMRYLHDNTARNVEAGRCQPASPNFLYYPCAGDCSTPVGSLLVKRCLGDVLPPPAEDLGLPCVKSTSVCSLFYPGQTIGEYLVSDGVNFNATTSQVQQQGYGACSRGSGCGSYAYTHTTFVTYKHMTIQMLESLPQGCDEREKVKVYLQEDVYCVAGKRRRSVMKKVS